MSKPIEISNASDDQALFEQLTTRPYIAWPTVILFFIAFPCYLISTYLAITGQLATLPAIALNSVLAFWCFTVMHDAGHNALSLNKSLNDGLGRLAAIPLTLMPILKSWRYLHSQHHRFANGPEDPDLYSHAGPKWLYPLRWMTLDYGIAAYYAPIEKDRPAAEQKETRQSLIFFLTIVALSIFTGYWLELLLFWYIPSRFAVLFLALAFDFLPHFPHEVTQKDSMYKATNNRIGLEWLLSPILLYQNYHLVHHLYPLVPFYRYIAVWKALEKTHLENDPNLLNIANQAIEVKV